MCDIKLSNVFIRTLLTQLAIDGVFYSGDSVSRTFSSEVFEYEFRVYIVDDIINTMTLEYCGDRIAVPASLRCDALHFCLKAVEKGCWVERKPEYDRLNMLGF